MVEKIFKRTMKNFSFNKSSLEYIQEKFPFNNVISNSVWIDVTQRTNVSWQNVQYFLDIYCFVKSLENIDHDKVFDEFIDYQTKHENDFPSGPKLMTKKYTEWTQCCTILTK